MGSNDSRPTARWWDPSHPGLAPRRLPRQGICQTAQLTMQKPHIPAQGCGAPRPSRTPLAYRTWTTTRTTSTARSPVPTPRPSAQRPIRCKPRPNPPHDRAGTPAAGSPPTPQQCHGPTTSDDDADAPPPRARPCRLLLRTGCCFDLHAGPQSLFKNSRVAEVDVEFHLDLGGRNIFEQTHRIGNHRRDLIQPASLGKRSVHLRHLRRQGGATMNGDREPAPNRCCTPTRLLSDRL